MHRYRRYFNSLLMLLSLLALWAGGVDGSGMAGRLTVAFLGPSSLCTQRHRASVASFLPSLPWSSCPPTTAAAAAAAGGRRTATLSPSAITAFALARARGGGSGSQLAALPTTEQLAALATGPVGVGLGTNTALALLGVAVKQRWLTPSGLLHAWVLGVALWSTLGWRGWLVCVLYLVFGSLVTKVKQTEKEAKGIAEKRGGARGPENVWGSAAAVRAVFYLELDALSRSIGGASGVWQEWDDGTRGVRPQTTSFFPQRNTGHALRPRRRRAAGAGARHAGQ